MYTQDRGRLRETFFDAWRHYREGLPLTGIEPLIVAVAGRHPEYHAILENPDDHGDRDYSAESGQTNPFLHLAMHIALAEQLSIDQPPGVRACYATLCAGGSEHDAEHRMMDCLGAALWQAGRSGAAPDADAYLDCLARLCGKDPETR
ncbi:MAG: DUF1841 family protein [Gammaproteobacteria bacterium]|nr:DUF1841 family protein [Gammaproteobacteria bacterium]